MKADQEFYNLREKFVRANKLYEDEHFKNNPMENGLTCMWARPSDLITNPVFNDKESPLFKFRRGQMSCEPFAAVVSILVGKRDLWNFIVAEDQSFSENYAGMFLFRFWKFGQIESITIDDVLPFQTETKVSLLSSVQDESLWCPLLEKAYAKFLGGYHRLQTVDVPEVMADILGCSVHLYNLKAHHHQIFSLMKNVFEYNGVALVNGHKNAQLKEDFNRLFIATSIKSEESEGKTDWYVTLHNPFVEINVKLFEFIENTKLREESLGSDGVGSQNTKYCMGAFQITFKQILEVFDELYIGHMRFPGLFNSVGHQKKNWMTQVVVGRWSHSREAEIEKYSEPMVRINVSKSDTLSEKGLCTVKLSLMQCSDHSPVEDNVYDQIGITILALKGAECFMGLPGKALSLSNPAVKSDMYSKREMCLHLSLEPGQYLLIPERNRKNLETSKKRKRYLMTLFSLEPLTILNRGQQKYGKEFLSPLELVVDAPRYVSMGDPIKVSVKILNVHPMNRYTITMLLSLHRTASKESQTSLIKARLEHITVCHALQGKELLMNVYYHEYIRFPLISEEFMARCSAFIHETTTEIQNHEVITSIFPKMKMTINRRLYAMQPCVMTTILYNTLPITIRMAKFKIHCSSVQESLSGLTQDVPPFSTIWIECSIRIPQPGCNLLTNVFTSLLFNRSVSSRIPVMDSTSPDDPCTSEQALLLGEIPVIRATNVSQMDISCCKMHKSVEEKVDCLNLRLWYINANADTIDAEGNFYTPSAEDMIYCRQTKSYTPE